jgi:hypothetical protein
VHKGVQHCTARLPCAVLCCAVLCFCMPAMMQAQLLLCCCYCAYNGPRHKPKVLRGCHQCSVFCWPQGSARQELLALVLWLFGFAFHATLSCFCLG